MFSIYLTNDKKTPGDISFGGYDLEKYAKPGAEITWADQSANEQYWAVNTKSVGFGGKPLADYNQQVIFDNGMSLAMAPEKSFVELMKALQTNGFECQESQPVWMCKGDPERFKNLPSIEFNMLLNEKGETGTIKMVPNAYIRHDKTRNDYYLLISPW